MLLLIWGDDASVRLKIFECETRALNLKFSCVAAFPGVEAQDKTRQEQKEEALKDIVKFLFNDLLLPNLLFSSLLNDVRLGKIRKRLEGTGLAFVARKSIVYL